MLEKEREKWLSLYWRSGTGRGQEPSSEQTKNFIQNNARGFIRPHRKHITGGTLACAETSGVAIAVHSLVYTILSSLLLSSTFEDR